MNSVSENPKVVALIPARSGSKGIPGKNIVSLGEKPLVQWTIEAALEASKVDGVFVSTDSEEIAEIARGGGAKVPFLRPAYLADDTASLRDVVRHFLQWYEGENEILPSLFVVLQPTSPFRSAYDIDAAIDIFYEREAEGVESLYECELHPFFFKRLDENGRIDDFVRPDKLYERRQDVPKAYAENGAIFVLSTVAFLEQDTFQPIKSFGYLMPVERSLDINDPWDLTVAQAILSCRK